jgi:hypothetical protein
MTRRTQLQFGGETVDGEELDFETIHEGWNEYACADGSTVKIKTVVSKIVRLIGKLNPDGEPIYVARSNNVLSVSLPQKPRS